MPYDADQDDYGKNHGKYDMDRVGLFAEMPYISIGDKYKTPDPLNNVRDMSKSQMYPGILKTKTGLQDAYFDPEFKRLYENEKWKQPPGPFSAKEPADKSMGNAAPFIPVGGTKRHSTPGDYFGTFGPVLPAMSTGVRRLPKREKWMPNFATAPTNTRGPGYTDIGLSPFPEYKSSPYDGRKIPKNETSDNRIEPFITGGYNGYFDKNPYLVTDVQPPYRIVRKEKFKGDPFLPPSTLKHFGNGFDKWPEHSNDRYIDPYRIGRTSKKGKSDDQSKIFYPQTRNRSLYTTSTMQRKLKTAMNNTNWRTFEPISLPAQINRKNC